jgi:hypothetical protein
MDHLTSVRYFDTTESRDTVTSAEPGQGRLK